MTQIEDGCLKIMEHLLKNGYSFQVPQKELENAIILCNMGLDERTWRRWTRALLAFEYLKLVPTLHQHTIGRIYEMNVAKIPNLFKVLKNQPQTHIATPSLSQSSKEKQP